MSEGDLLVTAKDSEVHMTMQDSGYIALRPGTRFRIVKYKADGGDDDKGVFSLLVGGMRSVTGWIGRYNQSAYQVRTPSARVCMYVRMARVNITVPDDVVSRARAAGLNVSRLATTALVEELDRRSKIDALDAYLAQLDVELGPISSDEQARAIAWVDQLLTPRSAPPVTARRRRSA